MNPPAPKYRSPVRDQPRLIEPTDYRAPAPPPGSIQYHSGAPDFSRILVEAKALNRKTLANLYAEETSAIARSLDALHSLAATHAWALTNWIDAVPHPANHVLFACFHKTLLSLHVAHELTLDGLYGMARPHLRQAFESLMIAKLCATDPESEVFDKWIDGLDLYFTNGVLRRIVSPDTSQFSESWRHLCQWSHATVFAAQLSLDLQTTEAESGVNLAFIGALLNFQDHLLNQHILTPTVKYYVKRYGDEERLVGAREQLKASLASLREILGAPSRRLVKDYRAKWLLK